MAKLTWILQKPDGSQTRTRDTLDGGRPALHSGEIIVGIKVRRVAAIVEAGEARECAQAARHNGEAGIALPIVRDV